MGKENVGSILADLLEEGGHPKIKVGSLKPSKISELDLAVASEATYTDRQGKLRYKLSGKLVN